MSRSIRRTCLATLLAALTAAPALGDVTAAQVQQAIQRGVAYLKSQQQPDGSWPALKNQHQHPAGTTALIAHALLTAGEPPDSPAVLKAVANLEQFTADAIDGNYAVGLQTMVFCEAAPKRLAARIGANVAWIESAQIREGDNSLGGWPGLWAHTSNRKTEIRPGDDSSTQYALLGLDAAARAGFRVSPETWRRCRATLRKAQNADGGWAYHPHNRALKSTSSMTTAGVAGLILTGLWSDDEGEKLVDGRVDGCGRGANDFPVIRGLSWLAKNFTVKDNVNARSYAQWRYYYLYGLERAARLAGVRYIGNHDWYREGAEELVTAQDAISGAWMGEGTENQPTLATSFALLFLATGRAPVLVHKLAHGPGDDWNRDPHDVRRLVAATSADWGSFMNWQTIALEDAAPVELSQAPIAFFNGHKAPTLSPQAKANLKAYIEQGGFLFAEACCGDPQFDAGFRALMKELFPEPGSSLHELTSEHAVWRARHELTPGIHPLWGIEHGCRTAVIYSPGDLSCYWNLMDAEPAHAMVVKARMVGRNVIDYATGRQPPPDKLAAREVPTLESGTEAPARGVLRIAKLKYKGDWNLAPLSMPRLADALSRPPLNFRVDRQPYELEATDPNLVYYPLLYMHGRGAPAFNDAEVDALRKHVHPGGGIIFADAACGGAAFDVAFRALMKRMLPDNPLEPIPQDDPIYTRQVGFDLSQSKFNAGAGGAVAFPYLEGVKIEGRWAVIYSKFDLGCALERHAAIDCQGYTFESALKIAVNIVLYASQHP
ncbi:MAG: prenyltransferase [Planctomycetales bacterium 71-10]|nr:MAG: prenyltransferase [Planctomycetales bacterium 71-10]